MNATYSKHNTEYGIVYLNNINQLPINQTNILTKFPVQADRQTKGQMNRNVKLTNISQLYWKLLKTKNSLKISFQKFVSMGGRIHEYFSTACDFTYDLYMHAIYTPFLYRT